MTVNIRSGQTLLLIMLSLSSMASIVNGHFLSLIIKLLLFQHVSFPNWIVYFKLHATIDMLACTYNLSCGH